MNHFDTNLIVRKKTLSVRCFYTAHKEPRRTSAGMVDIDSILINGVVEIRHAERPPTCPESGKDVQDNLLAFQFTKLRHIAIEQEKRDGHY